MWYNIVINNLGVFAMKETIVTIPINDLFAPKCGCPLCRMEEML